MLKIAKPFRNPIPWKGQFRTYNANIPKTTIKLAYLASQKLRDHTVSHDVIAYNGWEENDDSAVNKNLTVARIGNDNSLSIASITNKSIKTF